MTYKGRTRVCSLAAQVEAWRLAVAVESRTISSWSRALRPSLASPPLLTVPCGWGAGGSPSCVCTSLHGFCTACSNSRSRSQWAPSAIRTYIVHTRGFDWPCSTGTHVLSPQKKQCQMRCSRSVRAPTRQRTPRRTMIEAAGVHLVESQPLRVSPTGLVHGRQLAQC